MRTGSSSVYEGMLYEDRLLKSSTASSALIEP